MKVRFLYVPCQSTASATKLSRTLLSEGLIACANINTSGISVYHWKNKIEESPEVYVLLKTSDENIPALQKRIEELHEYDIPCIAEIAVESINSSYSTWLGQNLKQ